LSEIVFLNGEGTDPNGKTSTSGGRFFEDPTLLPLSAKTQVKISVFDHAQFCPNGSTEVNINDIPNDTAVAVAFGCPNPAFPTLLSGGYITDAVAQPNFQVYQNFPVTNSAWQVNVWNTSGQTFHLTIYTLCSAIQ
jgi:hypothetical protein